MPEDDFNLEDLQREFEESWTEDEDIQEDETTQDETVETEDEEEVDQVKLGMEIEQEHKDLTGRDKKKTRMIVDAHLKEDAKYYSHLKKMEEHVKKHEEKEEEKE